MGTFIATKNAKAFRHCQLSSRVASGSYYYTYLTATGDDVFKDTNGNTYTNFEMNTRNIESGTAPQYEIARYMLNLPNSYGSSNGSLHIGYSTSDFTEDSYAMDGVNSSLTKASASTAVMNVLYTITNNTGSDVTVNVLYIYARGYGYNGTAQRTTASDFLTGIYTFDPVTIPNGGSITVKVDN